MTSIREIVNRGAQDIWLISPTEQSAKYKKNDDVYCECGKHIP